MKVLGSTLFRSFLSLCIGLLLFFKAEDMPTLIVQIIGGFFVLSGVVGVSAWLFTRMNSSVKPFFPIGSVGCILLGIVPIVAPHLFVSYLVILFGVLLVMAGVSQLGAQVSFRSVAPLSILGFILPLIFLGVGLYIIVYPLESIAISFKLLGITISIYALTDMFLALRLRHYNRIYERKQAEEERRRQREIEASYVDFEVVDATGNAETPEDSPSEESATSEEV